MFHAERWHNEFPTPMIVHNNEHIFVNDFIQIHHAQTDIAFAKVLKFFQKVCCSYF